MLLKFVDEKVTGLAGNQRSKVKVSPQAPARMRRERIEFLIRRNGLEHEISANNLLKFMKMNKVRFSQVENDILIPLSRMTPERRASEISRLKLLKRNFARLQIIIGIFLLAVIGAAGLKIYMNTQSTVTADIHTSDAAAYSARCADDIKKRDQDRAIEDCTRAIELNPNDAHAYMDRGIGFARKHDIDRTIADFSRAIDLAPNYAPAYISRGIAYRSKGNNDKAIADFTRAIELSPNDPGGYNSRAWTYFKAGKPALGLPDAERSLELRSDDGNAWDTRGHIFEALGRREEAISDFRRALSQNPNLQESKDALQRLGAGS